MHLSKKVTTHPDIAHPFGNPPRSPTMKGIPAYSPLVKVARGVLFQLSVETTLESKSPKGWRGVIVSTHLKTSHATVKIGDVFAPNKGRTSKMFICYSGAIIFD